MADENQPGQCRRSRSERFFAGYSWLILKNLVGWTLILLSLVVGPLVPGPGGIPPFLIGFALVTFPGKRRLTARVLRGRRVQMPRRGLLLGIGVTSLLGSMLSLWLEGTHIGPVKRLLDDGLPMRTLVYLIHVVILGVALYGCFLGVNLLLRVMPLIRRRVRPWLRRHRIRLLPPRRRRRHPHEHGSGPLQLKDEILGLAKRAGPGPT